MKRIRGGGPSGNEVQRASKQVGGDFNSTSSNRLAWSARRQPTLPENVADTSSQAKQVVVANSCRAVTLLDGLIRMRRGRGQKIIRSGISIVTSTRATLDSLSPWLTDTLTRSAGLDLSLSTLEAAGGRACLRSRLSLHSFSAQPTFPSYCHDPLSHGLLRTLARPKPRPSLFARC